MERMMEGRERKREILCKMNLEIKTPNCMIKSNAKKVS